MPTFVPDPQNLDRAAEPQLPVGFGEGFATAFESAAMVGPLFATLQANEVRKANTWGTRLTADQARQTAAQRGFPALNIPDAGLTDQALEVMLSLAETDAEENEKLARTGTLTQLGGGFLGSMGDPVGGLLNFVPVVGNAKQAKIIAQASTKFGALGRAGARAGIGAVEGAAGGLLTIPASALAVTAKGGDYTLEDAIFEEVSSVVMGAGFQAGAGALGEGVAKVADQSSSSWIREKFGVDSQEWRQVQEAEQRARQEIEPEAKAQAEDEARSVAQPEAVEPVAPPVEPRAPGVEPQPVRKSRGWSGATFVRERLEVVSGLRNALGDLPVFREAAAKSDPLAVEIVDALRKSEGEIVARPAEFATLARAADAVAMDRANALTVAEGFQSGVSRNLAPHEQAAAVAFDALRGQSERMARMVATFADEIKAGATPDRATMRAVEAVSTPSGPTERGRIASPQTIESADAIADFLARSGVSPRAETIVNADPRIGETSAHDVADELARARQPGQQYNAAEVKAAQESFDAIEDIPDLDEAAERLADEAEAEYERITTATDVVFAKAASLPESIDIDGVQRSTKDSTGRQIATTEEGVRNFWKWFGDSKVVDEAGNPLTVYHGTNAQFDEFDPDMLGSSTLGGTGTQYGYFFGDSEEYARYWADNATQNNDGSPVVRPVYLKMSDIAEIEDLGDGGISIENELKNAYESGEYDGAKINMRNDYPGGESVAYVVFNSREFPGNKSAVKSAIGNRGTFDPANPDIRFAKGGDETGATPADARAQLVERFGEDLVKLGESFGVEIVPTWRDLPTERTGPDAIAVTKGRKTYIAAAQLPEGGGAGIYLHEMGVHVGLKGMLGEKGFGDILAKSESLLEADPTLAKIIDQMVPDDTPAKYRAEERLAYLVQNMEGVLSGREDWPTGAEWLRVTDPKVRSAIVELVRDLVAKAKAWVYESAPGVRSLVSLDERDFHALAVRALQYGFNGERMEAFAKVAKEAEDEVAAAREASKRARSVYKKAYDAFAPLVGGTDAELIAAARAVGDLSAEEAAGLVRRYREAGGDIAQAQKRVEADAAVQRLRAIKNAIKLHEALQFMSGFRDDPIEGLLGLDAGSLWNRKGARNSVEGWSRTWRSVLCNSAERQLKAAGLWDKINDEAFNRPLAHALYDLQTGADADLKGKPYSSDHLAAAKIFQEHQRRALSAQRRYGVDSGELKGRILDQRHDAWSLRNFANNKRTGPTRAALRGLIGGDRYVKVGDPAHKQAWVDFILPLLDEKTYDGRDVTREYLEASYDLLAGYKVPREREVLSGQYRELPGEAFRISNRSRKLKFKDADAWATYQERCGNPSFLENFMGEMGGAANALGVMEVYGPGAEYTRAAVHAAVGIRLTGMQAAKFQGSRTRLDGQWKVTTRQTEIPANEVLASVMHSFRALKRLSLLGSAVAAQLPDFGNIGKARALRFNRSANGVYSETARQMADFLRSAKGGANVEKLLTAYQSDLDATTAGLLQRIENGDAQGAMSNMVASLFKWQGMTWLTRNNKNGSIIGLASWLGQEARRGWMEIEPTTREHLEQNGFTEDDWGFMRRGEQIADDGRSYLTPEGLNSIPDAEIVAHLEGKGSKFANDTAKGRAVAQWRMDLQNRMIGMMHDFADIAIKEPDGRSRWFMTMGTQAGTALGETVRALSFLKSFTVSTMVNDWNTEMKGRSTDPRARVKAMSASHFLAVANYIAALTLLGFGSYMLKGWAKGIQRKGLADEGDDKDRIAFFDLPAIDDRVLFASMIQGGSMGLYGDFLFAEKNRFGGGLLETLSGPLIGDLEKLYQIGVDLKTKGVEDPGRLANNVANLGKSLTPFSNLWFSRAALDRMIWWNLQESINPDGLRRMEERAQKMGDRYIFTKPTEAL